MAPAPILSPTRTNIEAAAEHIKTGGIVAYPTETVYGLAVDPFDAVALERLFEVKGRPPDKPVLLLIHDRSDLDLLASSLPEAAVKLMDRFWPGPLTLLLPARDDLLPFVTSGSGAVAVRLSSNETSRSLCQAAGRPITSTSANLGGEPPASTAEQSSNLLSSNDGLVLDGHCESDALPSTIVDLTASEPVILRAGAIAPSEIIT
jgi:L-threonylcarbamoyladenylate synthase